MYKRLYRELLDVLQLPLINFTLRRPWRSPSKSVGMRLKGPQGCSHKELLAICILSHLFKRFFFYVDHF